VSDSLDGLLRDCTVRLATPGGAVGTGFFAAPGLVLTCAHVVRGAGGRAAPVTAQWSGRSAAAAPADVQLRPDPCPEADVFPDVALVRVPWDDHPCVWLDTDVRLGDYLYTYGYPAVRRFGDSVTAACEGPANYGATPAHELVKFKEGQVSPGLSGSPLLNLRTGGVCGVVKRTRGESTDLGGLAVRVPTVFDCFPELARAQQDYHAAHGTWAAARPTAGALARVAGTYAFEDIFAVLGGAPVPVGHYIRDLQFRAIVEDRTRGFVGREFVFKDIDRALTDPARFPSGYVLITGEPGLGKTAILAQLVKQRGYVHHFNVATQNIRSPDKFLTNVCAQLIVRYGLPVPALPARAGDDSGFLTQLLGQAAQAQPDRPVVVLVDALDEADPPPATGVNRLYLPETLPDGVYVVVTSRPQPQYGISAQRVRPIELDERDARNTADLHQYVLAFLDQHRAEMGPRLAAWGLVEDGFASLMGTKSDGNFMYLVLVLEDIRTGRLTARSLDDVRNLPVGLKEYYRRHWATMQIADRDRFERYYEPVVCQLGAAFEPVSVDRLARLTDLSPLRVKEVLDVWFQFLNAEDVGGEWRYRIYHASFQDFLNKEVGLEKYHRVIVRKALEKIPGYLDGPAEGQDGPM
jgi:hypothetical protein